MPTLTALLTKLRAHASPANVAGMARYGIAPDNRLGLSMPLMRRIAQETGQDHALALKLWKTGIPDARIVASIVADPERMSEADMEAWLKDFDSWDVCDQVCDNLFRKTPLVRLKIAEWATREEEFVKRAAFALIACLAWHDKQAPDTEFIALLATVQRAGGDERNYVKKAVNWALRNIGKRNIALNKAAIKAAEEMRATGAGAARWIASDALRELEGQAVQERLRKKAGARPPTAPPCRGQGKK